jgi:hypothetical protein
MKRVLFKGNVLMKRFDLYNRRGIEVEMVASLIIRDAKGCWGEDEMHMGILLECAPLTVLDSTDGEISLEPFEEFNGHSAMFDPVRWWRALQFLEALPIIKDDLFHFGIYWGIDRDPDSSFKNHTDELRQAVGSEQYDEIMSRPVPEVILALLIQMADEGYDVHSALLSVSDEIDARTVRWSQELRRVGVKHPDYWRAYAAAKAVIVARYEPYLFAYAEHRKCPYARDPKHKGWGMIQVEWEIVASVERGIEERYGADIAALLGILREEIGTDDILEELEKRHPDRGEGHKPFTRPTPDQRFQEMVAWFVQSFKEEPVSGNPVRFSEARYLETLHDLYRRWDRLPVVSPLVPEPE